MSNDNLVEVSCFMLGTQISNDFSLLKEYCEDKKPSHLRMKMVNKEVIKIVANLTARGFPWDQAAEWPTVLKIPVKEWRELRRKGLTHG